MLYFFWVDDCTKDVISAGGSAVTKVFLIKSCAESFFYKTQSEIWAGWTGRAGWTSRAGRVTWAGWAAWTGWSGWSGWSGWVAWAVLKS